MSQCDEGELDLFDQEGNLHLALSFGYVTTPGDTTRQQNWRAWVACEGVELQSVVDYVTFIVQDSLTTSRPHKMTAPPYELARASTVQGNHGQELQVTVAVHFQPWLKQGWVEHELLVQLRGRRGRSSVAAGAAAPWPQGPHTDDRMVVLHDPRAAPVSWKLHEGAPGRCAYTSMYMPPA